MPPTVTATLTITYRATPRKVVRKKQKVPPSFKTRHTPFPSLPDLKERQLSTEILSMQRRIREDKRQEHNAWTADARNNKAKDDASAVQTDPKLESTSKASVRAATKDDWKMLDLEDVQPWDLEQMDLTDLSPSLLAHPEGVQVNYTEQEKKMMKLIEKKTARHE
jgi:hypothetical protein